MQKKKKSFDLEIEKVKINFLADSLHVLYFYEIEGDYSVV